MFFARCKSSWSSEAPDTLVLAENDVVGVTHVDTSEEDLQPTGWLGGYLEKDRVNLGWFPAQVVTPFVCAPYFDQIQREHWPKVDEESLPRFRLVNACVINQNAALSNQIRSLTEENEILKEESDMVKYDREMLKGENMDLLEKLTQVKRECDRWYEQCETMKKQIKPKRRSDCTIPTPRVNANNRARVKKSENVSDRRTNRPSIDSCPSVLGEISTENATTEVDMKKGHIIEKSCRVASNDRTHQPQITKISI